MVSLLIRGTSGNPALDRRLDWARAYHEAGEFTSAEGMLTDLVGEAPDFVAAWFLLGEAREAKGDTAGAVAAFTQARTRAPDDTLGASLRLARLGVLPIEGAMSAAYVRALFDQYADRFDGALRNRLGYQGPELLGQAVEEACARTRRPLAFARGMDLGCGTGLAAPIFALWVERLEGVDLSPAMLAKAERLRLYDRLHPGDMAAVLKRAERGAFDILLAADALCYVADLLPFFVAARHALTSGGFFAFTLETHEGDQVVLGETLRYAHGRLHLAQAAQETGFRVSYLREASTRTEKGAPVPGLVAVLVRT